MYNLLNFYICIYSCDHNPDQDTECFFITQKVLLGLFPMNTLVLEVFVLTSITEEKWMTLNWERLVKLTLLFNGFDHFLFLKHLEDLEPSFSLFLFSTGT